METNTNIPVHVAILPDGNRRWAKEKGFSGIEGHRKSAQNLDKLLEAGKDLGIKAMTFWAFSTENWNRPEEERNLLFDLLRDMLEKNRGKFLSDKIRFIHLGRSDRMPKDIIEKLRALEEETKGFTEFTVGLALDYGGHDELTRAFKKMQAEGLEATTENIERSLDTANMPRVDMIIRTAGEQRLSGFMSWQSEYAEFYFTKVYFPDFDENELKKAIEEFSKRERRFGGN